MAEAMKGVTKAMGRMNKNMKLPQIQKIMQGFDYQYFRKLSNYISEFEKQSEMMNMKEEMMNDVMDDAMGDEDDEEESEAVVNKVLDELGLEMGGEMSSIPGIGAEEPGIADKNAPQVKFHNDFSEIIFENYLKPVAEGGGNDLDADLEARLNNLRR